MDGNGSLFGTLQGNTREVLHKFTVELPKKHGECFNVRFVYGFRFTLNSVKGEAANQHFGSLVYEWRRGTITCAKWPK
jgi:peptide subunit release factor 1 (eRF1)